MKLFLIVRQGHALPLGKKFIENMRVVYGYVKKASRGGCELTRGGGGGRNRTVDTRIFSPLLYRLSYPATSL